MKLEPGACSFEPLEFVAKLAALVPPPRFNMVRYHGILAPACPWRPFVVPSLPEHEFNGGSHPNGSGGREQDFTGCVSPQYLPSPPDPFDGGINPDPVWKPEKQQREFAGSVSPDQQSTRQSIRLSTRRSPHPRAYSWAELLKRVFQVDILECTSCGGRMRIIAAIHCPEAIRKILDCLGIPWRSPPVAAASIEWFPETV